MTRTPDTHFISEVRHAGAKLTVFSPDFSQVAKYADYWIPVHAGQDTAFWMAVNHVLLKEFYVDRQVPYFIDYLKRYTDMPFLVEIGDQDGGASRPLPARQPAGRLPSGTENGDWKLLVWDKTSGQAAHAAGHHRLPLGQARPRQVEPARCTTAVTGEDAGPGAVALSSSTTTLVQVEFDDFAGGQRPCSAACRCATSRRNAGRSRSPPSST